MGNRLELGSEYSLALNELNRVENHLFAYMSRYKTEWFDYGRSAISHIPYPEGKTVLLPEFLCESVIRCFSRDKIKFYRINENLEIDLEDLQKKTDRNVGCIYITHYFGYLQQEEVLKTIREIADANHIMVVEDTTQSLFSEHLLYGDYALASVRKWMPVPMGGVLYTGYENVLPEADAILQSTDNTRAYAMVLKDIFLKSEYDTNLIYRKLFAECEEQIEDAESPGRMSDFTEYIIKCVDIGQLIERRKQNYIRLSKALEKTGIRPVRELKEKEVPLVYPIRAGDRDAFRNYLTDHKIYCAVHWPFDGIFAEQRPNAQKNAASLLSLPIDQRYGEEEIDYMADVIWRYGGDLSF